MPRKREPHKPQPLTPKMEAFAREYLVDMNATQAALRAGYAQRSAKQQATVLLHHPEVQRIIREGAQKRAQKVELRAEDVLKELMCIAFVDPLEMFTPDGQPLPLDKMTERARRALSAVDVRELFEGQGEERQQIGVLRSLQMWNKPKALELLGKHLSLWVDKVEMKVEELSPEERKARAMTLLAKGAERAKR